MTEVFYIYEYMTNKDIYLYHGIFGSLLSDFHI